MIFFINIILMNSIHIFGDSHANYNFKNIKYSNVFNHYKNSLTMHRMGRDKLNLIEYKTLNINDGDIIIYQIGEVDCRCHIKKQLLLGRELNEIIDELVDNLFSSIKINLCDYDNLKIIVSCVPPPISKEYYEKLHGEITHEFPFVGTDLERSEFTKNVNCEIEKKCIENCFSFLNYYDYYLNEHNTLEVKLSDNRCHILKNKFILEKLYEIVENL
jgi:hypothetical protein